MRLHVLSTGVTLLSGLASKQVSEAAFKAAVDKFGERGVVDLTALMGYYCLVSMMLNIDRYPLADGETGTEAAPIVHRRQSSMIRE